MPSSAPCLPFSAFSTALSLAQFASTAPASLATASPNTWGCRRTSLATMPASDVVDAELALGEAQLRLEDDLQQQVAELLAVIGGVAGGDARRRPRRSPRRGRGRSVSSVCSRSHGQPSGREQALHEADELGDRGAGLLAGQRRQVGERGGGVVGHGGRQHIIAFGEGAGPFEGPESNV